MRISTEQLHMLLVGLDYALLAAGGIVLLLWLALWWRAGRRDPLRGSPLRPQRLGPLSVWVCLLAYPLGASVWTGMVDWTAGDHFSEEQINLWRSLMAGNLTLLFMTLICLAVARGAFIGGLRGFGLRLPRARFGWAYVPGGWLISIFVTQLLLMACVHLLDKLGYQMPEHNVFLALHDPTMPAWVHRLAIGGALMLAPIGEELFFRGVIQSGLRRMVWPRYGSWRHRWFAIVLTGFLFGLAHYNNIRDVLPLAAFGIILGYLYERTGSLYVPILVHMLFNAKPLLWFAIMKYGQAL